MQDTVVLVAIRIVLMGIRQPNELFNAAFILAGKHEEAQSCFGSCAT